MTKTNDMKRLSLLLALAALLAMVLITGCSYVRPIGMVGSKRFTKVQLGSLSAPGQTLLVIEDTNTHEVIITQPMGGNGVVPSLIQAGGIVGGAAALGNALDRNNGDRTTVVNNAGDTSVSTDVDNTVKIEDDPPAPPFSPSKPPKTRPPDNRPPRKW